MVLVGRAVFEGDAVGIAVSVGVGGTCVYVGGKNVSVGRIVLVSCRVVAGGKALGTMVGCGWITSDEQLAIRIDTKIIAKIFLTGIDTAASLLFSFIDSSFTVG
jgi:hypothetical protein